MTAEFWGRLATKVAPTLTCGNGSLGQAGAGVYNPSHSLYLAHTGTRDANSYECLPQVPLPAPNQVKAQVKVGALSNRPYPEARPMAGASDYLEFYEHPGWFARFRTDEGTHTRPVVRWDHEEHPWRLGWVEGDDTKPGELSPAASWANFVGYEPMTREQFRKHFNGGGR